MKATGIVRKIDELGRVVLPIELRRTLGLDGTKDPVEIFVDGDRIILKKYNPGCTFCGNMDNLAELHSKHICGNCMTEAYYKHQ